MIFFHCITKFQKKKQVCLTICKFQPFTSFKRLSSRKTRRDHFVEHLISYIKSIKRNLLLSSWKPDIFLSDYKKKVDNGKAEDIPITIKS